MRLEWMAPSMWRVLERPLFVVLGYLPGSSISWTGEQALVYLGIGLLLLAARWLVVRHRNQKGRRRRQPVTP